MEAVERKKNHIVMKSNQDYIYKAIQSLANPKMIGPWKKRRRATHTHTDDRLSDMNQ